MRMTFKAVVLGLGLGFSTVTMAQTAQPAQYQSQMPNMMQGMGQPGPMMNNPQMQAQMTQMLAQMAQMQQGCERMMSNMGNRMQQAPNRR